PRPQPIFSHASRELRAPPETAHARGRAIASAVRPRAWRGSDAAAPSPDWRRPPKVGSRAHRGDDTHEPPSGGEEIITMRTNRRAPSRRLGRALRLAARRALCAVALSALLLSAVPGFAQEVYGSVVGKVQDPTGAAVVGAT